MDLRQGLFAIATAASAAALVWLLFVPLEAPRCDEGSIAAILTGCAAP